MPDVITYRALLQYFRVLDRTQAPLINLCTATRDRSHCYLFTATRYRSQCYPRGVLLTESGSRDEPRQRLYHDCS